MGIGNYFVNYAIARSGDGGNREIKDDSKIEVLGEDEKIIESNRTQAKESSEKWENNIKKQSVETKAKSVLTIGEHFSEKGYNVLIPSMRACAESDGDFVGMGWLDKDDLKCWVNLILEQNSNANIILHGSSMGAATVLMASGDELPQNVKAIIADSGYTSVWDIFASEAKARFGIPAFPVLNMFQVVAKIRAGYDIKKASALEQVKKSNTPILFIHGDKDDFVPESMCEKLYDSANCIKEKLIISGAGHTDSKYKEPNTYYNKIFEFLGNI